MDVTSEIELKRKLIEATDAVRKKYYSIKNRQFENKSGLEEFHQPVTTRLKSFSDAVQVAARKSNVQPPASNKSKHSIEKESILYSPDDVTIHDNDSFDQVSETDSPHITKDPLEEIFSTPDLNSTPPISKRDKTLKSRKIDFFSHASPHTISMSYVERIKRDMTGFDVRYGIRVDSKNKLHMGNTEVRFPPSEISFWRGNVNIATYPASAELLDLLFLKHPKALENPSAISEQTKSIYRDILYKTNVIFNQYNPAQGLNRSQSRKYKHIIRALIFKEGKSIARLPISNKQFNFKNKEFVYWNTPKELIDRLRLLWASKLAGSTAHDNEILSILEELREADIIY